MLRSILAAFFIATASIAHAQVVNPPKVNTAITLSGDVTGSSSATVVGRLNGAPVPANPTLNQVLLGTASNVLGYTTVPDCQDSQGNHLNYNGSTQAWTCGTTASGASSTVIQRNPGYISGNYYIPNGAQGTVTGVAGSANTLYCYWGTLEPNPLKSAITIAQLGVAISTAGAAGGSVDIEVYNNNPSTGRPGTVAGYVAAFADTSASPAGGTFNAPANTMTLSPAGYWWCSDRSDAQVALAAIGGNEGPSAATIGSSTAANAIAVSVPIDGISISKAPSTTPADLSNTTAGPMLRPAAESPWSPLKCSEAAWTMNHMNAHMLRPPLIAAFLAVASPAFAGFALAFGSVTALGRSAT